MEDERKEGAATANGLGGEDYIIVKAGEEGSVGSVVVAKGCYRRDLADGRQRADLRPRRRRPGSRPGRRRRRVYLGTRVWGKKGQVQDGKVAASAVAVAWGKKPGLSQSTSFPATPRRVAPW